MSGLFSVIYDENGAITEGSIKAIPANLWKQTSVPQFFKPFQGFCDVASAIIEPVVAPIGYGVPAIYYAGSACYHAFSFIAELGAAGVLTLFGRSDARDYTFKLALASAVVAGLHTLVAAYYTLLAVISMPVHAVALVTRTAATLVEAASDAVDALLDCCCPATTSTDSPLVCRTPCEEGDADSVTLELTESRCGC
ncbi:MAG: hypothetical protein ACHP65_03120 [Legionellales bacterium]